MGYFANGSEGDMYRAQWCDRCVHDDAVVGCPVWNLHLLYNYDQLKKTSTHEALGMFIPEESATNGRCVMFWERGRGGRGPGEPLPVQAHLTVVKAA